MLILVTDLEYLEDKKLLASASDDNTIFIFNMSDPYNDSLIEKLTNHTNKVTSLIYIQSQSILAIGSWDETVKLRNTNDWTVFNTLKEHKDPIYSLLLCDNDTILLSGSWDRTIQVWEIPTGELLDTINTGLIIYSMILN
jgi:WD40 repeat protein